MPPHSDEAEQGVLGCILLAPNDCLAQCRSKFGVDEVFYDLRHQTIWNVLVYLQSKERAVDIITVQQELKDRALLDQIGGISYLNALQDSVPSAANLSYYLDIVWEKFIFRRLVQKNTTEVSILYEHNGAAEEFIARVDQNHAEWKTLLDRGAVTPKHLKPASAFQDAYYARWFDRRDDTYGYSLPFEFPLRMRPAATTLMTGDNGSGKSTKLLFVATHVATQIDRDAEEKIVLACMETPPENTLYIMARQLLNSGPLEHTADNERRVADALAWLNGRVLLYDFLGITNRHELLAAFAYAAEHQKAKWFVLDNLMKVGIADDDYAAQGLFVQSYCDFNMKWKTHGILVAHENKGEGNAKQKVRGSKQITDAPDNVVGMKRNDTKKLKLDELDAEWEAYKDRRNEIEKKRTLLRLEPDGWFSLYKQRWEGSQQNARTRLYFTRSLRFTKTYNEATSPMILLPKPKTQ